MSLKLNYFTLNFAILKPITTPRTVRTIPSTAIMRGHGHMFEFKNYCSKIKGGAATCHSQVNNCPLQIQNNRDSVRPEIPSLKYDNGPKSLHFQAVVHDLFPDYLES